MTRFPAVLLLAALTAGLLMPAPLPATNGMYLTAYGAEAAGRAGANLAIADRTLALNTNPAGITQLQGNHGTLSLTLLAPSLQFDNLVNAPLDGEDQVFPLPAFAFVRGGKETPWSYGVGLLAQGGMGAHFKNMNTFFGTRDETFSEVRFMTLTPTIAYALSDDMALGASFNLGYSDVEFKFFPRTSFFNAANPAMSFFGVEMDKAGGLQYNLRLGWWWRANPRLSVGAIYQTETESEFEDGDTIFNFNGHPFLRRHVSYTSDVEGFTFAAQAGVGIAYKLNHDWLLALDVKQYYWDHAIDTITVTARDPDVPGAPPEIVLPFVFEWKDQWVYALGLEYRVHDRLTLRAGYNYGENPVPDHTLNPLFPANVEHHLTFGLSWLRGNRSYELALEHVFENDQTNNNPNPLVNPFGPGASVSHSQWTLSFGVSWAWARQR